MNHSRSGPHRFIYARFLPLSLVAFACGLGTYLGVYVKQGENLNALRWNLTHVHMNYADFGFVKRGLLGTLFQPLLDLLEDGGSMQFSVLLAWDIGLCCLFIFALSIILKSKRDEAGQALTFLMLVLLIAPTGVLQLSFDITRYDHLNFLLVIPALLLVWQKRPLAAGLVMLAAVLNHEAVVVYGLPVVLAYGAARFQGDGLFWRKIGLLAAPPVLGAILVLLIGGSETAPATILPPEVSLASSVWSRSVIEPALFLRKYQYLLIGFYAVMPFLLLHWYYRRNGLNYDLLFLAPFAALALFALGVDYARWCGLIFFACACVIVLQFKGGHKNTDLFAPMHRKILFVAYVLPLGPIGITHPLPYLTGVLGL